MRSVLRSLTVAGVLVATTALLASPAQAAVSANTPADCPSARIVDAERAPFDDAPVAAFVAELAGLEVDCVFDVDGASREVEESDEGVRQRILVFDDPAPAVLREVLERLAASGRWTLALPAVATLATGQSVEFATLEELVAAPDLLALSANLDGPATPERLIGDSIVVEYHDAVANGAEPYPFPFFVSLDPVAPGDFPTFDEADRALELSNAGGAYLAVQTLQWSPDPVTAGGFGIETPSVLSGLPTIGEAVTPAQVGFASGGAIVLGLVLTFPSRLLSAVKDRLVRRAGTRVRAWWARRTGRPEAAEAPGAAPRPEPPRYAGWPLALGALLVASILAVFIDPRAGFDGGTLRLFGSVALGFLFDVALGWIVLILVARRLAPEAVPRFRVKPWSLLLVVGAVVLTRVTSFEPGLTVGLVAGVVFGGAVASAQRVRLTLTVLGYGFALSVLAWIAYSALSGVLGAGQGAWAVFLLETLAAITVAGIVALPLALLPVRGLAGHEIFVASRRVWAVAYGIGFAGFLLVLVPFPTSWREVPISFVAWLGLVVAYAVVAVATWLAVFRPWAPPTAEDEAERAADVAVAHR